MCGRYTITQAAPIATVNNPLTGSRRLIMSLPTKTVPPRTHCLGAQRALPTRRMRISGLAPPTV